MVTKTDLTEAMEVANSMRLMPLLKWLYRSLSPKQTKSEDERARILLSYSFAHVGVFARFFMTEYITSEFGKHHDPYFARFHVVKRGNRSISSRRVGARKHVYGGDLSIALRFF